MTKEEKEKIEQEISKLNEEIAEPDWPAISRFIERVRVRAMTEKERMALFDAEQYQRSLDRQLDYQLEARVKAEIFDKSWLNTMEVFHERHLPEIEGMDVEILTNDLCVTGEVLRVDAGYLEILGKESGRVAYVPWSAGPVIRVMKEAKK